MVTNLEHNTMPISHKHNCIFIHIPKTAGTSIEASLGMHGDLDYVGIKPYINQRKNQDTLFGVGLQHLTALQVKRKIKNYDDYYKFTFVRNPWSRFVSAMIFNGSLRSNLKSNLTKSEFKKNMQDINYSMGHFKCQLDYIEHDGNLLVDFVGRFENLHEDYSHISSVLGVNLTLEHRMKTEHKHYTEYYDDETRQIVAEKYARDIEYFGYKFGG